MAASNNPKDIAAVEVFIEGLVKSKEPPRTP